MGASSSSQKQLELANEQMAAMKAKLDALEAERAAQERTAKEASEADFVSTTLAPAGSQALMGSGLGSAAGYTLRVIGRVAAFGVGSGFIALQTLSYLGYLKVDWRKVERDTTAKLDRDGDGELTSNDLKLVWQEVQDVLSFNLPAGAGFTAGLLWGMGASATYAGGGAAVASVGARLVLPRILVGGATATGVPAAVIAAKHQLESSNEATDVVPSK